MRSISYNKDREITGLTIANDSRNGKTVYELKEKAAKVEGTDGRQTNNKDGRREHTESGKTAPSAALSDAQLRSMEDELRRTGVEMEAVKERYKIGNPSDISEDLYGKIMAALAKTKSKAA